MAVDRNDKRFFDFMCSCSERGERECEETYDEVMQEFQNATKRDITDKDFTDLVVYGLGVGLENGEAEIVGIPVDMWSAVSIEYMYDFKENEHKTQEFWIECDKIHHGLARAYQLVKAFDESLDNM